jgi:hypothetical protein
MLEQRQIRAPDARRLELKAFIHRPVARLPRYELLLRDIMAASPMDHEDRESIPQIIEIISELNRSTNAAIGTSKQKVEIWNYAANLVWKPGESIVSAFTCQLWGNRFTCSTRTWIYATTHGNSTTLGSYTGSLRVAWTFRDGRKFLC